MASGNDDSGSSDDDLQESRDDDSQELEEVYQRLVEKYQRDSDDSDGDSDDSDGFCIVSGRLENESSKIEERQRRHGKTIKALMEKNLRTKQRDNYCFLYFWLFSDCHVSLETPSGTYISIHPPGTKGFQPYELNVVQSLEDDIKRLVHPAEVIPLFGLNVHEIDDWYNTIDVHSEQWNKDYSMLATALSKGSNDFENYFANSKPSNPKSPYYIYAAAWDHTH